jgi:hypothetical protein
LAAHTRDEPPLVPGTIHGVRSWRLRDGRIDGVFHHGEWLDGGRATLASCEIGSSHKAPRSDCTCGIYAYHPWSPAARAAYAHAEIRRGSAEGIAGIVEAWGEIEVHADGFRAERARPVVFFLPRRSGGRHRALIETLAERHHAVIVEVDGRGGARRAWPEWAAGLDEEFVSELVPNRRAPWRPGTARGFAAAPSPPSVAEQVGEWLMYAICMAVALAMWAVIAITALGLALAMLGI